MDKSLFIPEVLGWKTENEYKEFFDSRLSKELRILVLSIASVIRLYEKDKELIITEVYRTLEERHRLYPEGHRLHNVVGAHELWKAIDLRVWNLDPDTVEGVLRYYETSEFDFFLIYHKIRKGVNHFHIQMRS